jgi:hypothetical protein
LLFSDDQSRLAIPIPIEDGNMNAVQRIQGMINERQRQLAAAEQEVAYLKRDLITLASARDAMANASAAMPAATPPKRPRRASSRNNGGATATPASLNKRPGRKLSAEWQAVIGKIGAIQGGVTIDQIYEYAKEAGITTERGSVRAAIWGHCKRGRLVKHDNDKYAVPSSQ